MDHDSDRQRQIDDYVNDRMDAGARADFEALMDSDPALTREVNELRRVIGVLSESERRRSMLARWKAEYDAQRACPREKSVESEAPGLRRRPFSRAALWSSAAVALTIVAGAGIWLAGRGSGGEVPLSPAGVLATGGDPESGVVVRGASPLDSVRSLIEEHRYAEAEEMLARMERDTVVDMSASPEEQRYMRMIITDRQEEMARLRRILNEKIKNAEK